MTERLRDGMRAALAAGGLPWGGTGKYAANHAAGFMAGYLIAGAADEAARGVNRYLNGRRRHGNRAARRDENLIPSTLVGEHWAWTSRHPRARMPEIEMHHVFLPSMKDGATTTGESHEEQAA